MLSLNCAHRDLAMQLYTYDPAPNARRLTLFMAYKGIELETTQIDLGTREQLGEEYRAINPNCTVPALILDSGELLSEVVAQCAYLESVYPDKPLMGATDTERAQVLEWDHRIFSTGFAPIGDMLRNFGQSFKGRALPGPVDVEQLPELVERGRIRIQGFWGPMDQHLANRDFIVGNQPSLADIDLFCLTEFVGWVKEKIPEECTALQAWRARSADVLNG